MTSEAAGEPIRVFLVDDQELVRAGFRMLVDCQPDIESSARPATAARPCSGSRSPGPTSC